jgi:hypothetical protein
VPVFHPQDTALQRMHLLDRERGGEPQDDLRQPQDIDAVGLRAAQNRLDMLRRVIDRLGIAVEPFPFRLAHVGMRRQRVFEVVFVEVGIERHALAPQRLVILGARQRRQEEELEHVEWHLLLDDLDVAPRRFRRVVGEAENVAGIGPDAGRFPGQQHVAILGDLVLPLLRSEQIVGVDVLQPDEDAGDPGAFRLGDEIRHLVAHRVDLDEEAHVHAVLLPQLDDDGRRSAPSPCCARNCHQ